MVARMPSIAAARAARTAASSVPLRRPSSNADSPRVSASTMVLSPSTAAPTRWTPSSDARMASTRRFGPNASPSPSACPAWTNAVPYSGPAAPPTIDTNVLPAWIRSWLGVAPSSALIRARTALKPRCMLVPWSASPLAATSWVRELCSASIRAAATSSQWRTHAASTIGLPPAARVRTDCEQMSGASLPSWERRGSARLALGLGHAGGAVGGGIDLLQAGAGAGLDRGDDRPLHQRGVGDAHASAALVVDQLLDGELGREHGRAEVHDHQHAVALVGVGDGAGDQGGVGADGAVLGAAGGADAHPARHLRGHLNDPLGHFGRVRDDHHADAHG